MSRRRTRADGPSEAGTDSFLDILANLVGILVILVVVVAIRVKQTVRGPVVAEHAPLEATAPPRRESAPIDVPMAAPKASQAADPAPSADLVADAARLAAELAAAQTRLASTPRPEAAADDGVVDRLQAESDDARRQTARLVSLTSARAADVARLSQSVASKRAELDDAADPRPRVESLHHEVRPLARTAGRQSYLHLAGGRLTVIPGEELVGKALRHQRDNLRTPRFDGTYAGRVGPVDGVTLSYETRRTASALDAALGGPAVSQYWFEVTDAARRETVEEALAPGSAFRRMLAAQPSDGTLSCIVKPDSYAEARRLQEFVARRPQRLAFLPTAADVPAMFGSGGVRVMGQ